MIAFAAFCLFLVGCEANYKDVSDDPDFLGYTGQSYRLKKDMLMIGVNLPPGYGQTIDAYYLRKLYEVEHKGREYITRDILPKGSKFTIQEVYECTNCLSFGGSHHVYVDTEDFKKQVDVPIRVKLREITSEESVERIE